MDTENINLLLIYFFQKLIHVINSKISKHDLFQYLFVFTILLYIFFQIFKFSYYLSLKEKVDSLSK